MVASKRPKQAAAVPLKIDRPLSAATMVSPRTARAKNSGSENERIIGRTSGIEAARNTAPITPPNMETV